MFTFELHKLTQWHLGLEEFLSTYCQDFLSCEGHSTILINTSKFNPTGPYTRGYLAALHFLRGCCEIRRLPWSKNNKNKKIIINLIFASRLSLFLYRGWCFAAAGKHYFEPLSRCHMVPQQVELRLPRRRDTHAIIRSPTRLGNQGIRRSSNNLKQLLIVCK